MRNYIVTEYVHQHDELCKIWSESECTLRVIMTKDPRINKYAISTWFCAVSFARFGTMLSVERAIFLLVELEWVLIMKQESTVILV